ncbi:MAG: alpha/beta hydrolase [Microcella sp.]|uniref:alpha/beta fold hydrolase n=1 Tax=Microcella sp. TaxID=1913979 RepID=UPI0027189F74|nr:alpha/beta hydrolase [Microcella sp.]MDO8337570.1 alpha/beta hydrolase [Microcella sp.]
MAPRPWRGAPLLAVTNDSGSGPVVVMIHGVASSSVTFHHLVPLLEPHFRVITLDILGFGASPAPEGATYTLDEHERSLHATLRSLGLRRDIILVGHSLGGLIAARYAATHRKALSRLVLIGSPIYLPPALIGDPVDRASMGAYFSVYEFLRSNPRFTTRAAAALASIAPIKNVLELTETNWTPFMLSLQNAIESQTTLADLARVSVPIDLVYGALDPFLAPSGIGIVEQLRHVTTHRVSNVAHILRPRLAQAVARVLASSRPEVAMSPEAPTAPA